MLVYIWGGEAPHIGAVAMATPRPSLADPTISSATASVFTYVGHKEDRLVQFIAEQLATELESKVVVTAGIHWDNLHRQGIKMVESNAQDLTEHLLKKLRQ